MRILTIKQAVNNKKQKQEMSSQRIKLIKKFVKS